MFDKKQLKNLLNEKFGVTVVLKMIGEETVLLYHEELDERLISKAMMQQLPNPVLFHTYIYNEQAEWIIGIAIDAETNNSLFLVCLKDGVKVYQKLLV